jgi:hypothetical protein
LIVALDEIRHEKDAHLGKHGRGSSARVADRNVAGFDGIDDRELLGQQRTRVEFNFELALCPLVDRLGHLGERHGGSFGRRHDMGRHELLRCRLGEGRARPSARIPTKPPAAPPSNRRRLGAARVITEELMDLLPIAFVILFDCMS